MPENVTDIIKRHMQSPDYLAAFEAIYANAAQGGAIPWSSGAPHPLLVAWGQHAPLPRAEHTALVVGCGTGEDAEYLARRGYRVTAFDVAPSAIAACHQRYPQSPVTYLTADLFQLPAAWHQAYDLVLECRTLQALPWQFCEPGIAAIAGCVRPGGSALVICLGRDADEDRRGIPWPLARVELAHFAACGLHEAAFDDVRALPRRHFCIRYERPAAPGAALA